MDPPKMEMSLDIEELKNSFWEQAQIIAVQRKHIAKLEVIIRTMPETKVPLDEVAQRDLEAVDGHR